MQKSELMNIVSKIGLKASKSLKSEAIIETIANYYSFSNLNNDMSNMDMNANNFFEKKSNLNKSAITDVGKSNYVTESYNFILCKIIISSY